MFGQLVLESHSTEYSICFVCGSRKCCVYCMIFYMIFLVCAELCSTLMLLDSVKGKACGFFLLKLCPHVLFQDPCLTSMSLVRKNLVKQTKTKQELKEIHTHTSAVIQITLCWPAAPLTPINHDILLEKQSFAVCMSLLKASSTFGLGRRC